MTILERVTAPPRRSDGAALYDFDALVQDLAKTLKIDSVSRLHLSPPLHISPEQTVGEAVRLLRDRRVARPLFLYSLLYLALLYAAMVVDRLL